MWFRFMPKEVNFFDLFDKQAKVATDAASFFKELMQQGGLNDVSLRKMYDIEHQGDEVTYSIIDHLNKTFITPFDREDIHSLAKVMDDIIDMLRTIINRMSVYQITNVDKNLAEFGCLINESVSHLACAVRDLRNLKLSKDMLKSCLEISRLEKAGDSLRDAALADLFKTTDNPVLIIKLKEIYQDSEAALDICKDAAHVVEAILVKQA